MELQRFFDHYTKDIQNGWETTTCIRATVLPFNRAALTSIPFRDAHWPHRERSARYYT